MTVCCRRCVCCSVFTVCGSVQSFAGLLFTLGLVAFPAGWGSDYVDVRLFFLVCNLWQKKKYITLYLLKRYLICIAALIDLRRKFKRVLFIEPLPQFCSIHFG